jgi:hypothetical protein
LGLETKKGKASYGLIHPLGVAAIRFAF